MLLDLQLFAINYQVELKFAVLEPSRLLAHQSPSTTPSGDLGSIDAENFVRVFDRKKDMINRGGLKIYSAEVESVLAGHPGVVESAIIAKPCPVLGERVHAVIVTRDGSVSAEALRSWCAERLSDYKVPETIDLRAEPLPRNANGKVMKRQLREAWAAAQL